MPKLSGGYDDVLAAVKRNGYALRDAPEEMKNNESIVLAAVQEDSLSNRVLWDCAPLMYASNEMKNKESVVLAAVKQVGYSLQFASEELKNNEQINLAAVQRHGKALHFASEEMKNKESVVLAAVQQDGLALKYASVEMKNKESVVLAAVQQAGEALQYASDEMKNNESIVLAAVRQNSTNIFREDEAIDFASKEMKNKIEEDARTFNVGIHEYARGMQNPIVLVVSAEHRTADPSLICHNMNGEVVATVKLDPEDDAQMLRQKIVDVVHPPNGPASLNIISPGGQRLRDLPPSDSVQKWLFDTCDGGQGPSPGIAGH